MRSKEADKTDMDPKRLKLYNEVKQRGLTDVQEEKMLLELKMAGGHDCVDASMDDKNSINKTDHPKPAGLYDYNDLAILQDIPFPQSNYLTCLKSIDELLEKDKKREEDGFPRKIRVGRMVRPRKGNKDKVVVVPTTVEEKFIHDPSFNSEEEDKLSGSGDGDEGDVISEQPLRDPDTASGSGPGEGESGPHELESNAYDLGKILTEQFELPNLKDKGKKRSLTRYTYDLTDRHQGFGQIIDKKATLRKIVETNLSLGNIPDVASIDPARFLVAPNDLVYRILSREKDYESQAVVFFLRDYSGSMIGNATELVVSQHVLIYSWLLYQYAMQVESRFILHDTEAKVVEDFYTYYNSKVAGGTKVAAAYQLVNEIVRDENLIEDYNIYVFHGTDGDDWDTGGKETLPELEKMLTYCNRIGITIAEHSNDSLNSTEVERYLVQSKLLDKKPEYIRLDVMQKDADEPRLIEGIKKLIS